MGEPLGRLGDVRAQRDQAQRGLVVGHGVALGAQRDRHRGHHRLARQRAMPGEEAPQRAAADHQHRIVQAGVVTAARRVQLGQRQADGGKGTRVGHGDVQARARCEAEVADALALALALALARCLAPDPRHHRGHGVAQRSAGRLRRHLRDRADGRRKRLDQGAHLLQLVGQRAAQHRGHAELALALARRAQRDLARLGAQVEDGLRQRHRRLAVDRGMVQLGVHRKLPLAVRPRGEAVEDVELPERAAAVEQHRMQRADLRLQLRQTAALGQRDADDVLVEIRLGIDPGRRGQVQRHPGELAAQGGRERQARRHVRAHVVEEVAVVARRQLELVQRADVHRHRSRFEVQETGVEAGQLLHR